MFESLTEKFQRVFKGLRGQAALNEENTREALREIRVALLEADVSLKVVKDFIDRLQAKVLGQEVLESFSPTQQVLKIVYEELCIILGGNAAKLKFSSQAPTVFLLAGLQGSGKTTTSAKLARWLQKGGNFPLLVSVDVYRPAAREQLAVAGKQVGVPVFQHASDKPLERALAARSEARNRGNNILIVDTAGRLHIDDELMNEMEELKKGLDPSEILLVCDAMTGQDAVRSAEEFHKRLGLTGVVLTKLDGDARGGAALSIRKVTGAPIKFIGVGEKYDAIEPFYPDRIVSRVLGMGDVMTLIEKVEAGVDRKKAEELEKKLRRDEFTLEDFRDQLRQVRKMGPLDQLVGMLPKMGPFANIPKDAQVDEKRLTQVEAVINSMTFQERDDHTLIDGKRRKRIAAGSGTSVQDVNQVLKQYMQMKKMIKQYGAMTAKGKMRGLGKFAGPAEPE